MSGLLSSITSALERLFRNLLPSWGDLTPVPSKITEPSKLSVLEEGLEKKEKRDSDYETTLICQNIQNTETRWYLAIRRFLFWRKQSDHIEFYNGSI